MAHPKSSRPPDDGVHIKGHVTVSQGSVAMGKGARATNTVVGAPNQPAGEDAPSGPWWRRLSPRRLILGLVLALVAFGVSLWLYPGAWDQSWRTLVALAVAAVVGATLFLDAARNAFAR